MNELDSEVMAGILERRGFSEVTSEEEADILIFNTCSVRDLAERKVLGKIGRLGKLEKRPLIGIAGCMASSKKEALFQKVPYLDFVVGTNNIHELDAILDEALQKRPVTRVSPQFTEELDYKRAKRKDSIKASVSIIRGCNKFCTYCVVPYTRGREVSRLPESIVDECKTLADRGYKEVMLLGQNVNSYGKDRPEWGCSFAALLGRLNDISGLERIRFMTSHPVDISDELMVAIGALRHVAEYVHFPLQAGSNRILRKMNRGYTVEEYLQKVQKLRALVPDVALGTDIIVGFPGETEDEFRQTYDMVEQIGYSNSYLFAYSPRKGTPSTRWADDVPKEAKEERLQKLIDLQNRITTSHLESLIGKEVEVLAEEESGKDATCLKGRTRTWYNVVFPGSSDQLGTLQRVVVQKVINQTLFGTIIT
jgi:tRNA-2-methylthio-N6-dimethylallyladenosine synthase